MRFTVHTDLTEPVRFAIAEAEKTPAGDDVHVILENTQGMPDQSYRIRRTEEGWEIGSSSDSGFLYGLLYFSKQIFHGAPPREGTVSPLIEKRGIKFNIPLDSRTPSYADASDSASKNIVNMWELSFWREFLDELARNHYNVLSLWTLCPFASWVRIPEYPDASLEDVKRMPGKIRATTEGIGLYSPKMEPELITVKKLTVEEKIDFWRQVMRYAKDRCIEIYFFFWNIYVYGTETSGYGITGDQDDPVTRDYYYCGTKALLDTYPLLAGIGITTGENMHKSTSDVDFIRLTYGRAIQDYLREHPERRFRFIHRLFMSSDNKIAKEFADFNCPFDVSFKYSQAHMYSEVRPHFIDNFLLRKDPSLKVWLTVRNDDMHMLRWGDPGFARAYIDHMPLDQMAGFYMGPDGYTWGRDYMDLRDESHPLYIRKMWYMMMIWGWCSFYRDVSEPFFEEELTARFGVAGPDLYAAWKAASQIIPSVNRVHWHHYDFQWYPEGCCMYHKPPQDELVFADIREFMECLSQQNGTCYSVREYCERLSDGLAMEKVTPQQETESLREDARLIWEKLPGLRSRSSGRRDLAVILDDLEAFACLGEYYAGKIEAAVLLTLFALGTDPSGREKAAEILRGAAVSWEKYSSKISSMYRPEMLGRLFSTVDVASFTENARRDAVCAQHFPSPAE